MLLVQKYGGTSVGTPHRIQRAAERIAERHAAGDHVVVVVSAMGQTTDDLIQLARRVTEHPSRRELDMLLTAGERISMALLSMALNARDVPAISFTGSQSGIITDTTHTRARILEVRPIRILPELERGKVVIVAGFQGVSRDKEITTLGRGGSDTTAVALAAGLGAHLCEIYTDVPGVMTADPRLVSGARLIPRMSWDALLDLSLCGAAVMHSRAVALARMWRVPFTVRSSLRKGPGTLVEGDAMEKPGQVAAVTGHPHVARVRWFGLDLSGEHRGGLLSALEGLLEDLHALHMETDPERTSVSLICPVGAGSELAEKLEELGVGRGARASVERDLATATVVGTGPMSPALAARADRALEDAGVPVLALYSRGLSLTFLISGRDFGRAEQALHAACMP